MTRINNKYLELGLLRRGGIKLVHQLEARQRCVEKPNVVYSTQEHQPQKAAMDRNKGCIPCSSDLKTRNAFQEDRLKSGRTHLYTLGGQIVAGDPFRMRTMRKR